MTRTEAHERTLRAIANDGCGDMDSHRRTCRDRSDDPSAWCWCCIAAAVIEETDRVRALPRPSSPASPECRSDGTDLGRATCDCPEHAPGASPECRHERTRVDCANGETDATCLDCGAVWLDDGEGWTRASSPGARR